MNSFLKVSYHPWKIWPWKYQNPVYCNEHLWSKHNSIVADIAFPSSINSFYQEHAMLIWQIALLPKSFYFHPVTIYEAYFLTLLFYLQKNPNDQRRRHFLEAIEWGIIGLIVPITLRSLKSEELNRNIVRKAVNLSCHLEGEGVV